MKEQKPYRIWHMLLMAAMALSLSGCEHSIFQAKGQVGVDEARLIIIAFVAMLIVVVPTIALVIIFAWRYRASNNAKYDPEWAHSNKIEAVVWTVPIIIVAFLAVLAYKTSHSLDPFRPLESDVKPLTVQVVALDWKWLFIYPEQGIASINELYVPENTPVNFEITSQTVMNTFFIPQLGGMIYAMAGQRSELHLIANERGTFPGVSGNYSGVGYSAGMHFDTHSVSSADFDAWVAKAKETTQGLDFASYQEIAQHDHKLLAEDKETVIKRSPVEYFNLGDSGLFRKVLGQYVDYKTSQNISQAHAVGGEE